MRLSSLLIFSALVHVLLAQLVDYLVLAEHFDGFFQLNDLDDDYLYPAFSGSVIAAGFYLQINCNHEGWKRTFLTIAGIVGVTTFLAFVIGNNIATDIVIFVINFWFVLFAASSSLLCLNSLLILVRWVKDSWKGSGND